MPIWKAGENEEQRAEEEVSEIREEAEEFADGEKQAEDVKKSKKTKKTDIITDDFTPVEYDPDQYITRVGRFLRKTSLDEIPQLINILKNDMSVIGPRPALWNQYDLLEERDRYGANDIKPGLSGWAQICGRDELEIDDKASLDGEYVRNMSFLFDCRCFFGTAFSVLRGDGVVEGGTGELHKTEIEK